MKEEKNKKVKNAENVSYTSMPMNGMVNGGLAGINMGNSANVGMPLQKPVEVDYNVLKDKLENFKKSVIKKYGFTMALVILPSQAYPLFEEDEAMTREVIETRPTHMLMLIPEEQYKNIPKIKPEIVKLAKETKENLWVHIKTEVDLWNYGLDSKFEFIDAIAQGYPLYDKGFLGALRVASIHKSLVLRKFDKYVASYVIAGSLIRGTANKDSDVDVFVVIDDTDVKRMSRVELLERLRGMIYEYIREATALAGVKNILNVQVYLLTDFWQSVKDAHPVMFTFIRDGIPLWDRGTFIPWKLLLKMGKIKPSSEAIDLYMKQGEQTEEFVKRRLLDGMVDIYYGIVTPTQAMTMLAGEGPEVPKNIVAQVRRLFFEKEKLIDEKNLKILEKAVHLFKQYEYGKLKEYPGKDIDSFLKECLDYNKMLKELRKKIEKRMQEKTTEEIYEDVFRLLKTLLGDKKQSGLISDFESKIVRKGKIQPRFLKVLKDLVSAKAKIKSGKLNQKEVDSVKRDAFELMESLVEYAQRADLINAKKSSIIISYNGRKAELVLLGEHNYIIEGKTIRKIADGKLAHTKPEEFEKIFNEHKGKLTTKISANVFATLKKELGDFEIEF